MTRKSNQNVRDEEEIKHLTKRVEELVLIVAGSAALDHKGLIERQRQDENFQVDVLKILHENKKEVRELNTKVETLKGDLNNKIDTLQKKFDFYQSVLKLPTTKEFWIGTGVILAILILLAKYTDAAYNFIIGYIQRKYLS